MVREGAGEKSSDSSWVPQKREGGGGSSGRQDCPEDPHDSRPLPLMTHGHYLS